MGKLAFYSNQWFEEQNANLDAAIEKEMAEKEMAEITQAMPFKLTENKAEKAAALEQKKTALKEEMVATLAKKTPEIRKKFQTIGWYWGSFLVSIIIALCVGWQYIQTNLVGFCTWLIIVILAVTLGILVHHAILNKATNGVLPKGIFRSQKKRGKAAPAQGSPKFSNFTASDFSNATKKQVILDRIKEYKQENEGRIRNETDTFALSSGVVRGFLIIAISVAVLYYLFGLSSVLPVQLVLVFNVILVYYGIKPKEVLPTQLQAQIPEDFGTISSIPGVKGSANILKENLTRMETAILDEIENELTLVGNAASQAEVLREKIKAKINALTEKVNMLTISGKKGLEQYALVVLLVVIGIVNVFYLGSNGNSLDDLLKGINLFAAAMLAAIGVGLGKSIQGLLIAPMKKKIEETFDKVLFSLAKIKDTLTNTNNKVTSVFDEIRGIIDLLLDSNFLSFVPADIVACVSIGSMIAISGVLMLLPVVIVSGLKDIFLLLLEFIVAAYFVEKA
jgi:hypothetical protein